MTPNWWRGWESNPPHGWCKHLSPPRNMPPRKKRRCPSARRNRFLRCCRIRADASCKMDAAPGNAPGFTALQAGPCSLLGQPRKNGGRVVPIRQFLIRQADWLLEIGGPEGSCTPDVVLPSRLKRPNDSLLSEPTQIGAGPLATHPRFSRGQSLVRPANWCPSRDSHSGISLGKAVC